jgi:hypothetical protein
MTTQASDALINEHTEIDFGDLHPYGISIGDIQSNHGWGEPYPFKNLPTPSNERISFLWRGYISVYKLNSDGQLILEEYAYPNLGKKREPDIVNEIIEGDFHLIMRTEFAGMRTYIPFRSGRIVSNRDEWIIEKD